MMRAVSAKALVILAASAAALVAAVGATATSSARPVADHRGRHDEAVARYREALRQEPNNTIALNNLAYLLALQGRQATEALGLINRAPEVAGPMPDLPDTRAVVYFKNKQAGLAVKNLEQVVMHSDSPASLFHLAQAITRLEIG
jgi:tetratricopeptide (TPR) repeat protein